jgi:hypothetical protein
MESSWKAPSNVKYVIYFSFQAEIFSDVSPLDFTGEFRWRYFLKILSYDTDGTYNKHILSDKDVAKYILSHQFVTFARTLW